MNLSHFYSLKHIFQATLVIAIFTSTGSGTVSDYGKPAVEDENKDTDNDGLTNLEEYQIPTNQNNPDTDGDHIKDGLDGVANDPDFKHPRLPETSYAYIKLPRPASYGNWYGISDDCKLIGQDEIGGKTWTLTGGQTYLADYPLSISSNGEILYNKPGGGRSLKNDPGMDTAVPESTESTQIVGYPPSSRVPFYSSIRSDGAVLGEAPRRKIIATTTYKENWFHIKAENSPTPPGVVSRIEYNSQKADGSPVQAGYHVTSSVAKSKSGTIHEYAETYQPVIWAAPGSTPQPICNPIDANTKNYSISGTKTIIGELFPYQVPSEVSPEGVDWTANLFNADGFDDSLSGLSENVVGNSLGDIATVVRDGGADDARLVFRLVPPQPAIAVDDSKLGISKMINVSNPDSFFISVVGLSKLRYLFLNREEIKDHYGAQGYPPPIHYSEILIGDSDWKYKNLSNIDPKVKISRAFLINDRNEGIFISDAGENRLWRNERMRLLSDLVPETKAAFGYGINNNGVIVGEVGVAIDQTHTDYFPALLLPVEVSVRKKNTTAAPEDGLVVKKGEALEFAFAPQFFDIEDNFESIITWQQRQLKGDGNYSEWSSFGEQAKGTKFEVTPNAGGIFQFKAIVNVGGQTTEYLYLRKKDAKHGADSDGNFNKIYKKGETDCFGVVEEDWQRNVRNAALAEVGNKFFSQYSNHPVYPGGPSTVGMLKCNIFVYSVCTDAGVVVPLKVISDGTAWPPTAKQWFDRSFSIAGWYNLAQTPLPQPGYVVSRPGKSISIMGHDYVIAGHTGIVDYDGAWFNAGAVVVNKCPNIAPPGNKYQTAHFRSKTEGN